MFFRVKSNHVYIESILITFFATAGSFYYFVPGIIKFLLMGLWGIIMFNGLFTRKEKYYPIHIILIFFMIAVAIKNNPNVEALNTLPTILLYVFAIMFVFLAFYQNNDWYEKTIEMLLIPYFIYSAYTVAMHFFPQLIYVSYGLFKNNDMLLQFARNGLPGLTSHYSLNAIFLANGLMIVVCALMVEWKNCKAIIYSTITLLALLWTGKRAHVIFAIVALIITDFVYLSDNKKIRRKHMIMIVAGILLALAAVLYLFPSLSTFIKRFEETAETGDVTLGRVEMWKLALEQFKNHPIIGVGWSRFIQINPMGWDAHNVFIQLLCETGIVGTTIYLLYFLYCLFITYKMIKYQKRALVMQGNYCEKKKAFLILVSFCNQLFFIIYCFTGNPLYTKENYIPYFIACAYAFAEYRNNKSRIRNN